MISQTAAAGQAAPPAGAPLPYQGQPPRASIRFHAIRPDGTAGCNRELPLALGSAIEARDIPHGHRCNLPGCTNRWAA